MIIVLIPKLTNTSPVIGAINQSGLIAEQYDVQVINLNFGSQGVDNKNTAGLDVVNFPPGNNLFKKIMLLRRHLKRYSGDSKVTIISYLLLADLVAFFFRREHYVVSSVRGNLKTNYKYSFGKLGSLLSAMHFYLLSKFDELIAMHQGMADQLIALPAKKVSILPSNISEDALEPYRRKKPNTGPLKIVVLGKLSKLKGIEDAIMAVSYLTKMQASQVHLTILGDGPERANLEALVHQEGLERHVQFLGHIFAPYEILAAADVFLLPSYSEGVPRSALEALFLGIPCILRDLDGNRYLVDNVNTGHLFLNRTELPGLILEFGNLSRKGDLYKKSLLPAENTTEYCRNTFNEILKHGQ